MMCENVCLNMMQKANACVDYTVYKKSNKVISNYGVSKRIESKLFVTNNNQITLYWNTSYLEDEFTSQVWDEQYNLHQISIDNKLDLYSNGRHLHSQYISLLL